MYSDLAGVGFRHVLRDGLKVLCSEEIEAHRKNYVIHRLTKVFQDALKGLELKEQNSFFVGSEDEQAFNTYQFLDQYLHDEVNLCWKTTLPKADEAFKSILDGVPINADDAAVAKCLLSDLLKLVESEDYIGVPLAPEEFDSIAT